MYELVRLSEHDYYIDCPAKIGIVTLDGGGAILIDSGSDKDAAKKALRHAADNGWQIKAVFNTHSHADHIGGNSTIAEKTGCDIYAFGTECDFTRHTFLESAGLYGGFPFAELKHKFLCAKESDAKPLTEAVLPENFRMIPLPGHSFDMVGFLTPDGNFFAADCVSSAETLAKYGIGYLWDVEASLKTLEEIKTVKAAKIIPSHAPVTGDISQLADLNAEAIRRAASVIAELCAEPADCDTLLQKVFDRYALTMNAQQYVLIGSTVRSYLSYLKNSGVLSFTFENNRMLWHRNDT